MKHLTYLNLTYLIYIIFWELLVFGGAGYAVFFLNHSGWWFLAALIIGGCAYKPREWIYVLPRNDA